MKTGIEAKDYESIVTTKDLKPVELEAEKVKDQTENLKKAMRFNIKGGDKLKNLGNEMKDQITKNGVITVCFMIVATFLSTFYLRRYFKTKKDK